MNEKSASAIFLQYNYPKNGKLRVFHVSIWRIVHEREPINAEWDLDIVINELADAHLVYRVPGRFNIEEITKWLLVLRHKFIRLHLAEYLSNYNVSLSEINEIWRESRVTNIMKE